MISHHHGKHVAPCEPNDPRRPERCAARHVMEARSVSIALELEADGICKQVYVAREDGVSHLRDKRVAEKPGLIEDHVVAQLCVVVDMHHKLHMPGQPLDARPKRETLEAARHIDDGHVWVHVTHDGRRVVEWSM
eukprot:scaffold170310_cov28-Tisochrysis_lutea.AAC.3